MTPPSPWRPNGVVTWTTDFGLENAYVGTMRGVLHARAPKAQWIDLTHGVPSQAIDVAALELQSAYPFFAEGTLHVVVVDPGVGTSRRILAGVAHGGCFLGPDNGILPAVLGPQAFLVKVPTQRWALAHVSRTFHGRDVFAPVAAALLRGDWDPTEGDRVDDPVRHPVSEPVPIDASTLRLEVLLVDRFGNLITNWSLGRHGPLPGEAWIEVGSRKIPLLSTYAEAPQGQCLALLNSFGHLEIAVRDGHAGQTLGLDRGHLVDLKSSL